MIEFGSLQEAYDWAVDDRGHGDDALACAAETVGRQLWGTAHGEPPLWATETVGEYLTECEQTASELRYEWDRN